MAPIRRRLAALAFPLATTADTPVTELVEGTAVLLSQPSGGGGNGGNTSSTTSSTNSRAKGRR
jgi:hypothetical protein